jgi:YHS domain-containing protein
MAFDLAWESVGMLPRLRIGTIVERTTLALSGGDQMNQATNSLMAWTVMAGVASIVGCSNGSGPKPGPSASGTSAPSANAGSPTSPKAEGAHAHKPSAHGGIIVEIGRDNYHAEAVFEKGGILRLYMLGQDESKVQEIEAQPLTAYAKAEGDAEAVSFVLRPEPQTGDKPGMTSLFLSHLPKELAGKKLEVTIPSIRIGNDRFRISFKSVPDDTHSDAAMPAKLPDDDEQKLFLTPGGLYSEADIKANGETTPTLKFKSVRPAHDSNPMPGAKICPISETVANPKFKWVIGGKSYEFCCTPCIEEFLTKAKEKPSEIKDPEEYRKK